ncbi:MAG: tetratricopeptide repeat protein [Planctomycetes bacterium]|nr:tetratricopeptide repeat protein [Planctomycetota bacterium]
MRAAQRDPGALDDVARAEGLAPGLEHLAARGRVLGLLGRWEEALPDLQAVEAQRGDGDDLDALAACLLRLKRPRDAVALLDRAAKLEPDRAERWARLALTLAHLGDPAYGRTLAERALSLDPRSGLAICALGIARYHAGDRRGARVELDRGLALAVDPTALELRAQLRFNDGDWQGAVADLDRALALGPLEPARTYYNRGVFRSTPDPEAADADYDLALAADPRFLQALHARLGRRLRRGDYAGGRADVEAALKESPGDARLHYNLASLCRRLGDGDGALAAAARALELDPSMLHVHLTRGLVLLDRDQLPAALDEFGRSVAKAHDFASRGYALRALTRRRMGDLDGALDDAAQALALDPDEAAALTIRGLVRRARGERAAGDADLSRGLALAAQEDADLVRVLRIEVDR